MPQAKSGDTVKVHYTGKLGTGMVFDSSTDSDPLEFTLGDGEIIPGFEQAVIGMRAGESRTAKILANDAYGPYNKEMVVVADRKELPQDLEPEVGQELQGKQEDGQEIVFTVTDISESAITLDANHVLAGKDLIYDIQLIEIL